MSHPNKTAFIESQLAALNLLKDGVAKTSYKARYFTPLGLENIAKGVIEPDSLMSGSTAAEADTLTEIKRKAAEWATEQATKYGNSDQPAGYTADEWLRGILIVSTTVRAFPI